MSPKQVADKPLLLRKQGKTWYAITQHKEADSETHGQPHE